MKITIESCDEIRSALLADDVEFDHFCNSLFDVVASTYGWGTISVLECLQEQLSERLKREYVAARST